MNSGICLIIKWVHNPAPRLHGICIKVIVRNVMPRYCCNDNTYLGGISSKNYPISHDVSDTCVRTVHHTFLLDVATRNIINIFIFVFNLIFASCLLYSTDLPDLRDHHFCSVGEKSLIIYIVHHNVIQDMSNVIFTQGFTH